MIKRLLLGVAFAANAGSVLLPISSTQTLITVSCTAGNGNHFGFLVLLITISHYIMLYYHILSIE